MQSRDERRPADRGLIPARRWTEPEHVGNAQFSQDVRLLSQEIVGMSQCTYLLEYITTLQWNENDKNEKLSEICLHVHNKQVSWLVGV